MPRARAIFWSVHAAQSTHTCTGPFFLQFLPAIGSSDSLGLVTASVLFTITFALSKQGQSLDAVSIKNAAELERTYSERRFKLEIHASTHPFQPSKTPRGGCCP